MSLRGALLAVPLALAAPAGTAEARTLAFERRCSIDGAPAGSACGTLSVPEDRARSGGRRLALRFVVVRGASPAPSDPIAYIAGGPGESAVEALPLVLPTLRSVDPARDILFLERRGTGRSNRLDCPGGLILLSDPGAAAALRQCAARLGAHADLDRYSSLDEARDLEALRAALGYRRLNLVGVSYGVRVALLYMREHPRRVRAVVLRSAYPIDYNIVADGVEAADRALGRILDDCERDEACRRAFPQLGERLRLADARLAGAPVEIRAEGADGTPLLVPVGDAFLHQLLVVMMQSAASRQYVPMLLAAAASGDLQQFATPIAEFRAAFADFPVGLYLSVICAEDAPRSRALATGRTPLPRSAARLAALCSDWPVRPAAAAMLAPFRSDVPTLIVSGALDPVTPPQAAARLAAELARAVHIVVPATAHGDMFPDCTRPAVAAFLRTARPAPPGAACAALALPPFAVPASASPATPAAPAADAAASMQGTWDLEFHTRRGLSPGGWLVIRQSGGRLDADLHGRGSIRASGTLEGDRFTLAGSRLFAPYTLTGTIDGDRIEGVLKVLSVERRFTGRRRAAPR
jgi:pimeloyl-ACP methyl ester carboxylesterase